MEYQFKPDTVFNVHTDFMRPLAREDSTVLNDNPVKTGSVTGNNESNAGLFGNRDTVDISSAAGRDSLLRSLGAKYSGSLSSMVQGLVPTGGGSGNFNSLYEGISGISSHMTPSLISKYL